MLTSRRTPDLYACPAEGGAIVLDLSSERYYALPQPDFFASTHGASIASRRVKVHTNLVDMNRLLTLHSVQTPRFATLKHTRALLLSLLHVTIVMNLLGTGAAIRRITELKRRYASALLPVSSPTLSGALCAFRNLRPLFYTARNHCLFDTLVLSHYLLRLRYDTKFVIGVRTKPFGAHAWAQSGDYVLEDLLEKVQLFTPILVV